MPIKRMTEEVKSNIIENKGNELPLAMEVDGFDTHLISVHQGKEGLFEAIYLVNRDTVPKPKIKVSFHVETIRTFVLQ